MKYECTNVNCLSFDEDEKLNCAGGFGDIEDCTNYVVARKPKKYTIEEIRTKFERIYDGDVKKMTPNTYITTGANHAFNYYLQAFIDLGLLDE